MCVCVNDVPLICVHSVVSFDLHLSTFANCLSECHFSLPNSDFEILFLVQTLYRLLVQLISPRKTDVYETSKRKEKKKKNRKGFKGRKW